ncbi:PEP/pyruvate-binding domain-containing protein [Nonomuraea sp. LPB2021202275-12-8]|uniref:PEP/pyruvate-binding domain-containing protein n=1 Tax=Nonomuraea sp. LPB2021202275-12-8 TaxID=3120159 RepID=UPI00300C33BA
MMDEPLVLALDDARATLERAGGKGASLARLAAAGLPVPPGFHVTTAAYRHFVAAHGLRERIVEIAAAASPDRPETCESAAEKIAALFAEQPVPDEVAQAVGAAYAELGGDLAVAVRSSATAEDLPEMSFAGQQETYLNIRGRSPVLDAVKRCWASLWTARAIGYRARQGIDSGDLGLAVVVQELVPADAAGVLFTADPLTGARDRVMVNAAWGLGESVVGGQVTPDTIVVAKADGSIVRQEISDKQVMTVRTPAGTREEPVPAELRERPVLDAPQAAELARLAVAIEELYDRPMDIEWARHDGRLHILQARPITALPGPAPAWELPDPKGRYVRGSVTELLPEPLSPLFATLGLGAWKRATVEGYKSIGLPYFEEPFAVIGGYAYYNITYTPGMLARMMVAQPLFLIVTLPRGLRAAAQRWERAHAAYADVAARRGAVDTGSAPAGELFAGAREIVEEAARYYAAVQGGVLPAAYISESLFTSVYKLVRRPGDPPALTFLLGFDSKPMRADKSLYDLARWGREQPGLAERVAHGPVEEPEEFAGRFAAHLAEFGDTVYDLDFAKPLPVEDPAPLLRTVRFYLTGEAPDPHERQRAAREQRELATRRLHTRRGLRTAFARWVLRWAQKMAPLREDALADVGLGWPAARRALHEIGRRLVVAEAVADEDDVFWLRMDELEDAAEALDSAGRTPVDWRAVVAERRATWRAQRAVAPPHALPDGGGMKILGIDFSRLLPGHRDDGSADVIKGVPGSPGRVSAPVRIIHGSDEFAQMRQGDVLVARITTPAWTPLFALASAVVTDVGGPLSHSSIVAREYGIPAVLGTGAATERLRNGQQVIVDGEAGTVTLVHT